MATQKERLDNLEGQLGNIASMLTQLTGGAAPVAIESAPTVQTPTLTEQGCNGIMPQEDPAAKRGAPAGDKTVYDGTGTQFRLCPSAHRAGCVEVHTGNMVGDTWVSKKPIEKYHRELKWNWPQRTFYRPTGAWIGDVTTLPACFVVGNPYYAEVKRHIEGGPLIPGSEVK